MPLLKPRARVIDFYGCRCYRGQLAEKDILLTHAPQGIKHFADVADSECPLGRDNPELLLFVWYPANDDVIAINFVIFGLACDGSIIPLVFQSKYSADGSTTRLGKATVSRAYDVAKEVMKRAGWEPEEFIFVIHTYRDITGSFLGTKLTHAMATPAPVADMMLLDKPTLQHLYGSLGLTIQYAWLRRQVKASN